VNTYLSLLHFSKSFREYLVIANPYFERTKLHLTWLLFRGYCSFIP